MEKINKKIVEVFNSIDHKEGIEEAIAKDEIRNKNLTQEKRKLEIELTNQKTQNEINELKQHIEQLKSLGTVNPNPNPVPEENIGLKVDEEYDYVPIDFRDNKGGV